MVKLINGRFFNGQDPFVYTKRKAFTLAEVLITLGIIGVVAVMVLPNMYANFKKRQTVVGLQVAYSMISQAVKQSVAENGEIASWDLSVEKNVADKYIVPYLAGTTKLKVRYNMRTLSNQYGQTGHTYLDWSWNINNRPLYALQKGMVLCFANANDGFPTVIIDINGAKPPNIMGIDGFAFWLDKGSSEVMLSGVKCDRNGLLAGKQCKYTSTRYCLRDSSWQYYRGGYCGAVIQKDGWKISEDYPWGNGDLTPVE